MDSPKYVFSKIPNDAEGHAFVEEMKKYLNKDRYELVKKIKFKRKRRDL